MAKSTPDRPVPQGETGGGDAPGLPQDTGLRDTDLRTEDKAAEVARPDTPQETTGGVEPRESRPTRIHYRGLGTIRRITEEEWKGAGVHDMETVEWNRHNKWSLPIGGEGGLSDAGLDLIKGESEFSVE